MSQPYKIPLIKNPFFKPKQVKKQLSRFVIQSDYFSMSQQCAQFEEAFAQYQGRKYCVLYHSGSSANFALIQALANIKRLNRGDFIGFTAIGWPTTITPLIQTGLKPVPIDIDLSLLNNSLSQIKKTQTELKQKTGKTLSSIFITNILGASGDLENIQEYCRNNNILLLEDNCESLGTHYKGNKLGNFSEASTFSFFIGHHLSCIEGGAVCTDDDELARMLVMVRAHGWDRNLTPSLQKKIRRQYHINDFHAKYTFYAIGMNLRPTEITGKLGNLQLPQLAEIVKKRQANYHYFVKAIEAKIDKVYDFYHRPDLNPNSNFAFPIVFRKYRDFNKTKSLFDRAGIEIRPIIGGNLASQPFFQEHKTVDLTVENADLAKKQGFYFGNNPDLTKAEIKYIYQTIMQIE